MDKWGKGRRGSYETFFLYVSLHWGEGYKLPTHLCLSCHLPFCVFLNSHAPHVCLKWALQRYHSPTPPMAFHFLSPSPL